MAVQSQSLQCGLHMHTRHMSAYARVQCSASHRSSAVKISHPQHLISYLCNIFIASGQWVVPAWAVLPGQSSCSWVWGGGFRCSGVLPHQPQVNNKAQMKLLCIQHVNLLANLAFVKCWSDLIPNTCFQCTQKKTIPLMYVRISEAGEQWLAQLRLARLCWVDCCVSVGLEGSDVYANIMHKNEMKKVFAGNTLYNCYENPMNCVGISIMKML